MNSEPRRWACANVAGGERPTEAFGDLPRLWVAQHRAVLEEQRRQFVRVHALGFEQRPRIVALDVEPAIRNQIAGEKVLDGV